MHKKRFKISNLIIYIILILVALLVIAPLALMVITALKDNLEFMKSPLSLPSKLNFNGFISVFTEHNFMMYLGNSLFVTLISLAISLTVSITLSYALCRYRGKWINRLYFYFLAGMIIPIRLGVLFLNDMLNALGLLNSLWGLICIYTAMSIPFSMYIMSGYVKMIPKELDEAAMIDGCSKYRIFSQVVLPLLGPSIITTIVISFYWIWDDYMGPLLYLTKPGLYTVSLGIKNFADAQGTNFGPMFAMSTLSLIPVFLLFLFFNRYLMDGVTAGSVKG